jgi:hypothetical protein
VQSRIVRILGMVFSILLFANAMPEARATDINIGTNACQNGSTVPNIGYASIGVYTIGGPTAGFVTCSLPRAPLSAGQTVGGFFVDGDNYNGGTAACTLYSINFNGAFLGSVSFTATEDHFDRYLGLPAAQLPFYAYTYLVCSLSSDGNTVLRGVTSLQ